MPSSQKFQSPFASSFRSAVRRGVPASQAVHGIAQRSRKSETVIFQSLFKADLVWRQKFNSQWIWWAADGRKAQSSQTRSSQFGLWQSFVDWAIASGHVTPEQIQQHSGSQQQFSLFLRKFFGGQFGSTSSTRRTSTSSSSRSPSTSGTRRSSTTRRRTSSPKATTRPSTSTRSRRSTTARSSSRRSTTTRARPLRLTGSTSRRLRRAA